MFEKITEVVESIEGKISEAKGLMASVKGGNGSEHLASIKADVQEAVVSLKSLVECVKELSESVKKIVGDVKNDTSAPKEEPAVVAPETK